VHLLSRARSPCLSGPNIFPTATCPDLAGGSPQLHGDLAAAGRPHPARHPGLPEALPKQQMAPNLRKNFCSRKATPLLDLRSPPPASGLHLLCRAQLRHRAQGRAPRAPHLGLCGVSPSCGRPATRRKSPGSSVPAIPAPPAAAQRSLRHRTTTRYEISNTALLLQTQTLSPPQNSKYFHLNCQTAFISAHWRSHKHRT